MRVQCSRLESLNFFRTNVLGFRFTGVNLFVFLDVVFGVRLSTFLFFLFVLFKNGAAYESVCRSVGLRFFMLGFNQAGGNYGNLFFGNVLFRERRIRASRLVLDKIGCSSKGLGCRCSVVRGRGQFFRAGRGCVSFVSRFGEQPAWQTAGGAPGNVRATGCAGLCSIATRRNRVSEIRLRFVNLSFNYRRCRSGGSRFIPIFREGFARQEDVIFRGSRQSWRRAETRAFRPAIFTRLKTTTLLATRVVSSARIAPALVSLRRSILG